MVKTVINSLSAFTALVLAIYWARIAIAAFDEPISSLYDGPLRPQIHFSPPRGFMNDPNGMFKDENGTYHLYYQFNPSALTAGNQHWGHATSKDLYHWANHPIAISPESADEGIFSGSAVIDRNNTSGFFPNQENGVVAIYTLSTQSEQAQHIAFSRDGGATFSKYAHNPVISIGSTDFRDPKVFWHASTARWVAVIAYAQEYVIGIWTSQNLRDWSHASNFSRAGFLGLQYECPNLVPIPILRNASLPMPDLLERSNIDGEAEIWMMFISINPGAPLGGSASEYIPGHFNGTHFSPLDSAARLTDFAKDNYAGQFFAETNKYDPLISIQWASNWQYTNDVPTDGEGFRSFMALPRRHALANITRAPYSLISVPEPFENLRTTKQPLVKNEKLANRAITFEYGVLNPSGALVFSMVACSLPQSPQGSMNFTFISSATGERIRGGFLFPGDSTFYLDRSGVRGFENPYFTDKFSVAHPVDPDTRCLRTDVVIDRSIIEIFLDNGARSGTSIFFSQGPMDMLEACSGGIDEGVTIDLEIWGLSSTWMHEASLTSNMSQVLQVKGIDRILHS